MVIAEDARYPTIRPIISNITGFDIFVEKNIIMLSITHAPANAEIIIAIEPFSECAENKLNELPKKSIVSATPRFAPSLMPRIEGPASGFLNSVCNSNPLTAREAPANKAVTACGKRDCKTICCHVAFSGLPPDMIFMTSPTGINTEPYARFATNRAMSTNTENKTKYVFL